MANRPLARRTPLLTEQESHDALHRIAASADPDSSSQARGILAELGDPTYSTCRRAFVTITASEARQIQDMRQHGRREPLSVLAAEIRRNANDPLESMRRLQRRVNPLGGSF
jgi:hypothetical protein